jgi:hypothetical protein
MTHLTRSRRSGRRTGRPPSHPKPPGGRRSQRQGARGTSGSVRSWLLMALPAVLLLPTVAVGAPIDPAPGESPANYQQYFSSHNSYQRDESLTEQLDFYNVWEIELDVRWRENALCQGGGTGFYILHACEDPVGRGWLVDSLNEIAATRRMQDGFFFLNLELGDASVKYACLGCGVEGPSFPPSYLTLLQSLILDTFSDSVYTWQDFVADGKQWPSIQELLRRGKHVAVYANDIGNVGSIFFEITESVGFAVDPVAVWNTDDPSTDISGTGERFLTRRYPDPYCWMEDSSDYYSAREHGFSHLSTNCIQEWAPIVWLFHPPLPTYLVPVGGAGLQLGTWGLPYRGGVGVVAACQRAGDYDEEICSGVACRSHPSTITLELVGGTYNVSGGSEGVVLDCPVTLTAVFGPARLE